MAETEVEKDASTHKVFDALANLAQYLYLVRVPLLIAAFIFFLPLVALRENSSLNQLLQNLFWLDRLSTFWFTVIALALSWSLLITASLVLLNAQRFGLPFVRVDVIRRWSVWIVLGVAAPMSLGQFTQYEEFDYGLYELGIRGLIVAAGVLVSYLLMFFAVWGAILLAPKDTQTRTAERFPGFDFMRRWLQRADERDFLPRWVTNFTMWIRDYFPPAIWDGYLNPNNGIPWAGHWLAFWFGLVTCVIYFGIDIYRLSFLGERTAVPALAFALLLLINVNWVLSFLTFFLDRFRIPLLIPLSILCVLGTRAPSSDHYYGVRQGVSILPVRAEQAISARIEKERPIVLVAAAGGGIQAAAWTAQVLAGLEQETRNWEAPSFARSVALISSVSGGAVGAMYYLNLFQTDSANTFDQDRLNQLVGTAAQSSLDDIGWALVYRDFPRMFFPYSKLSSEEKLLDRGTMLEESWRNRDSINANLSNWRIGVAEGNRPAAIFNATIAETGEPLVFATTEVRSDRKSATSARRTFYDLYPDTDLAVVTAVRLAATFPYVSPAARALTTKPEYHVVDGGYYDNYGISSLITWLDQAFTERASRKQKLAPVLIVQIRAFPNQPIPAATNKGWFFQAYAPLNALMGVRAAGQLVRGQEELRLFAEKWAGRSEVSIASFEFQGHNAPLSWSMNPKQQLQIKRQWEDVLKDSKSDLRIVRCFFAPKQEGCLKQVP